MPRALCGDAVVRLECVRRHVRAGTAATRPQHCFVRDVWRHDVPERSRHPISVFRCCHCAWTRLCHRLPHRRASSADSATNAFPTPPPLPTPMPTPPQEVKFNFDTMVTNSVLQLGDAGSLFAINNVNSGRPKSSSHGPTVRLESATRRPTRQARLRPRLPHSFNSRCEARNALDHIQELCASESATLVAFNRLGRRRAGETAFIEIKDPNTPLMPRTAIGFDTFEIRPGANSSFGVASIDSPLPDPSMFVAEAATTTTIESDATAGEPTSISDALSDEMSSEGFPTYAIAIIAVVGVILLIALFVAVFLAGKRRGSQAHEQPAPAASVSASAANTTQQLYSSLDQVPKPTSYSGIVVAQSPTYTEMEMASARENYDELQLQAGTPYFNGEALSAPSKGR
jgi:hypothetical protein